MVIFFLFFSNDQKEKVKYFLDLKKKYTENKGIANVTKKKIIFNR